MLDLSGPPDAGLSPRDAALSHAICDAVMRRWLTLDSLLSRFLKRPLTHAPHGAQAALLAGSAQLLFLDRVPDHAAISQSVLYARRRAPLAAGLVNAVLRELARAIDRDADSAVPWSLEDRCVIPRADGRAVRFVRDMLPEDLVGRLEAATGCPRVILDEWTRQFGPEQTRSLALHSIVDPPIIINTAYLIGPRPDDLTPHCRTGSHVWTGAGAALGPLLASRGDLWVQDPASSRAVPFAKAVVRAPGESLIVDMCAGQGTKTRQLLREFPDARIIATDADRHRLTTLKGTFAGESRVRVVPIASLQAEGAGATLVLADVPCSNSGVLPRRPEAKYRWGTRQGRRLVETQREIIRQARDLLTRGGVLVYSTCSLDRTENEDQVRYAESLGYALVAQERIMPAGLPGESPTVYQDGAFIAVMRCG
jgi:16S rRNA (cytosine967-C5)-methyltransferase